MHVGLRAVARARRQRLCQYRPTARADRNIDQSGNGKDTVAAYRWSLRRKPDDFSIMLSGMAVLAQSSKEYAQLPVEPNPPIPRVVSSNDTVSRSCARITGAITSCAMRMPRVTLTDSAPKFTR